MRGRRFVLATVIVVMAAIVLLPSLALAQALPFADPTSQINSFISSSNWLGQAQGWAWRIYTFLLVFELIALAITAVLFRDNLGELFAGISLKILLGGVFMWFVVNAGSWAPAVINTFKGFGTSLGGTDDPAGWVLACLTAAGLMYASTGLASGVDTAQATLTSANCVWVLGTSPGPCLVGLAANSAAAHNNYILIANGVCFMLLMAAAVVLLQFLLLTIESQIVMGLGVLFIGFAGSRFTMQFSQGYFSYMINVGVKLMVLYIIVGIEMNFIPGILTAVGVAATAGSLLGGAPGAYVAIGAAAWAAFQVMVGSALVALVPGICASLLTGSSSASGATALQSTFGAIGAARQFQGQMDAARMANLSPQAVQGREAAGMLHGTSAHGASQSPSASVQTDMAPKHDAQILPAPEQGPAPTHHQPDSMSGSAHIAASRDTQQPLPTTGSAPLPYNPANPGSLQAAAMLNNQNMMAAPPAPTRSLADRDDVAGMNEAQIRSSLAAHPLSTMSEAQVRDVLSHENVRDVVDQEMQYNRGSARAQEESFQGSAIGALAQTIPRDVGQPTAVQVRISNPDKL